MTSANGPRCRRKLASSGGRQDVVERRGDVGRRQTGGLEARLPDRHVAAVDQDDDRVGEDADEGEAHARVAAVRPERDEEEPEGRRPGAGPGASRRAATPGVEQELGRRTGRRRATKSSPVRRSRIEARLTRCRRRAGRGRARARCRRSAWAVRGLTSSIMRGGATARRVVASGESGGLARIGRRDPSRRLGRECGERPVSSDPSAGVATWRRRAAAVIRSAAWAISGIWRGSGRPARVGDAVGTARPDEGIDDDRVELDAGELAQLGERLLGRQRRHAVGAGGRHRLERVGDVEDPGELRDLVADQPIRVARAVVPLVVVADDRQLRRRAW